MTSEPPRRPGSGPKLGPKLGFDDTEQKEFSRALKQGLLVQTPLQVLLESLFTRLQMQAGLFADLSRKVERLEARDLDSHELLHRLQLCETKVTALSGSKLSPFSQQEVLSRLDALEKRQGQDKGPARPQPAGPYDNLLGFSTEEPEEQLRSSGGVAGYEARLAAVEGKLSGVYNLTGKLIAVDHMATELGLQIPDLEYNPGMIMHDDLFRSRSTTPHAASHLLGPLTFAPTIVPLPAAALTTTDAVAVPSHTAHTAAVPLPPVAQASVSGITDAPVAAPVAMATVADQLVSPPGSPLLRPNRSVQLLPQQSMGAASVQQRQLVQQQSVSGLGAEATQQQQQQQQGDDGSGVGGGRAAELKAYIAEVAAANEALRDTVASLTEELQQARQELGQRHILLRHRVDALEATTADIKGQLTDQQEQAAAKPRRHDTDISYADFTLMQSQVAGAVRDVEAAKDAVSTIRDQDLKALADAIAELRDANRKSDAPRDMDTLFHQRLTAVEGRQQGLTQEVQLAASEALQGVARASDVEAIARELELKASQQDIRQLALQQQTLAQSVNGMAEWLAVRPETADGAKGTGSSMTKFKCLTCDREMPTQSGSNGNPTLRGSFLPKLEGAHPSTPTPIGPGLNTGRTGRVSPGRTRNSWAPGSIPTSGFGLDGAAAAEDEALVAGSSGGGAARATQAAAGGTAATATRTVTSTRVPVFLG